MNNKGVSAVIGVILMVAITVAIAATVYVYVSDILNDGMTDEEWVESQVEVLDNYEIMDINFYSLWQIRGYERVEFVVMDFQNGSLITVAGFLYNTETHELGYNGNSDIIWLCECDEE